MAILQRCGLLEGTRNTPDEVLFRTSGTYLWGMGTFFGTPDTERLEVGFPRPTATTYSLGTVLIVQDMRFILACWRMKKYRVFQKHSFVPWKRSTCPKKEPHIWIQHSKTNHFWGHFYGRQEHFFLAHPIFYPQLLRIGKTDPFLPHVTLSFEFHVKFNRWLLLS